MSTTFLQKVATFMELSAAELQAAHQQLAEQATKTASYQTQVAASVDQLAQHGFLKESGKANAKQQLLDPNYALSSLVKVALSQPSVVPSQLGSPVTAPGQKQAGDRQAHQPRQRDIDFVTSLGLPSDMA